MDAARDILQKGIIIKEAVMPLLEAVLLRAQQCSDEMAEKIILSALATEDVQLLAEFDANIFGMIMYQLELVVQKGEIGKLEAYSLEHRRLRTYIQFATSTIQ